MTNAKQDEKNENALPPRVLPDPALCRAQLYGKGALVECLVKHPVECPHALNFLSHSFCDHPQRKEIAARTKAEEDK